MSKPNRDRAGHDWDPELYNRFRRYRAEPVAHILSRLRLGDAERICDLGCGSGENTIELARLSAHGTVCGIDGSPAMVDAARKVLSREPEELRRRVSFEIGEASKFHARGEYTLIFSNALFHWIRDRRALFAACFDALKLGGRIVVQIPANESETAKAELAKLAREEPWHAMLGGMDKPFDEQPPEYYARMLAEIGYGEVDCYHRTFHHPMERSADVAEWYRSTGLRPFLDALPAEHHEAFLDTYRGRLERAYSTAGPIVFNFRRLFIWARRP
ncbi:MAG: methyltransferase domain-containing protein [Candidatus Binataceae bacterium]